MATASPNKADQKRTEEWRLVLTTPGLAPFAKILGLLHGHRRCPLCYAPYTNPYRE